MAAEQKSQLLGREYTNIKYSAEQSGIDPMRTPFCRSTLSLAAASTQNLAAKKTLAGSRTVSNSSLVLPRPPDEIPRAFYENLPKERKDSANGVLPDLNIGPPPSFAPPAPPGKNK